MNRNYRQLKVWDGIILFVIVMVAMIFIGAPVQYRFGIYGLAVTEIMFLIFVVLGIVIFRCDYREVFRFRKFSVKQFFGAGLIWGGAYLGMAAVILMTQYFFPGIVDRGNQISQVATSSSSIVVTMVIMAVLPAICEELLHRGFILASFGRVKNEAVTVFCVGLIFGIFHLDGYRFIPTMMLGMAFTYMAVKTKSVLLPMLFHFFNNMISVVSAFSVSDQTAESSISMNEIGITAISGLSIFYIGLGLLFVYAGRNLMIGKDLLEDRRNQKKKIAFLVLALFITAAGFLIYLAGYAKIVAGMM